MALSLQRPLSVAGSWRPVQGRRNNYTVRALEDSQARRRSCRFQPAVVLAGSGLVGFDTHARPNLRYHPPGSRTCSAGGAGCYAPFVSAPSSFSSLPYPLPSSPRTCASRLTSHGSTATRSTTLERSVPPASTATSFCELPASCVTISTAAT